MNTSINPVFLIPAFAVVLAAVSSVVVCHFDCTFKPSRQGLIFSVAPSLMLLVLFYSLAIHMHESLGSWPSSIGERGFPSSLLVHSNIAANYFTTLLLGTLFLWPVAFLVCLLVRRWRRSAVYLNIHALAFALCVGLMELAPSSFLYWWHD